MGLFDSFLSADKRALIDVCKKANESLITILSEFDKGADWATSPDSLALAIEHTEKLNEYVSEVHSIGSKINNDEATVLKINWINGKKEIFPMYKRFLNDACKHIDTELAKTLSKLQGV